MVQIETSLSPESIDVGFPPRRRSGTAEIQVRGERVVAVAPFEPCHVLNPTAGLLWQCFDGEVDLATLIDEITEETGADRAAVELDVVELTRHFGRIGLLEGVAPPKADLPVAEIPAPLGEGDHVEGFVLPDLAGVQRDWSEFRGRRALLVNWSVTCGFCLQIAPELAECRQLLLDKGIEMVFVATGSAEDNRPVFEQSGLDDTVVLCKVDGVEPFPGLGTPAAYLLDAEGRLEEPLAYGALDVPEMLRRLAGITRPTREEGVRYLAGGAGVCGPVVGIAKKATEWAGISAYRIGETRVGLRYNTDETAAVLDRLLPNARVDDPGVPENFSVALYPDSDGAARQLNLLVRSGLQMVRSRSQARVLRGLLGHLSYVIHNPDRGLLQADGLAVIRDGEAFVLPSLLHNMWSVAQPKLSRLGLQVVDRPWASIDPRSAELVVAEPLVDFDRRVLDELDVAAGPGRELPEVQAGRYPLHARVMAGGERADGPLSTGGAVALAMGSITWIPGLDLVLEQLAELFSRSAGYALAYEGVDDFLDELPAALA